MVSYPFLNSDVASFFNIFWEISQPPLYSLSSSFPFCIGILCLLFQFYLFITSSKSSRISLTVFFVTLGCNHAEDAMENLSISIDILNVRRIEVKEGKFVLEDEVEIVFEKRVTLFGNSA